MAANRTCLGADSSFAFFGSEFMDRASEQSGEKRRRSLSEDWASVILGLVIVLLVAIVGGVSVPWPLFGVFG